MMSEIRRPTLLAPLFFFGCLLLFTAEASEATKSNDLAKPSDSNEANEANETSKPADSAKPILEYQWEQGFQYQCRFEVNATVLDTETSIMGTTVYSPLSANVAAFLARPLELEPPSQTAGTAFVVGEGLLVTCAHVVEDATKIDAYFGEKKYAAEVIALDVGHDLAILKIEAQNLPSLKFCDSNDVELAQDIRVIGYPLSDVLGESVKMSRGTVSGIIRRGDDRRFQIDARVNPGNSGGPLVDRQGRVVGVASELLVSEAIDSIGFAIPSNEVVELLRENDIHVPLAPKGPEFDGPELAKRVTPAVALLRVESRPGAVDPSKQRAILFTSVYSDSDPYSRPVYQNGKMLVDTRGKVTSNEDARLVPFIFESAATIGIEQLPGNDRTSWGSFRFVMLRSTTESRALPYRSRRAPSLYFHSPSLFGNRQTRQFIPAIEEVRYERLETPSKDGTVSISKKYHLHTVEKDADGKHALDITTEGKILWDPEIGCVKKSQMKGQFDTNRNDRLTRIPIEFEYEIVKVKVNAKVKPKASTPAKPSSPPVRKISPPTADKKSPKKTDSIPGLDKFNPND